MTLSINPTLALPLSFNSTSSSSFPVFSSTLEVSVFPSFGRRPVCLSCKQVHFPQLVQAKRSKRRPSVAAFSDNNMAITEVNEEKEEQGPPVSEETEGISKPRRIVLFVEPSPFAFPCPWYQKVPLSLALSPRIILEVARFNPDIIHASSPGIMSNKIRLWNKGVDSESFHPRFCNHEMRLRLSNGEPDKPLIVHVGRLGVEKSLDFLKRIMDRLPDVRIAFIGDGPYREELEKMFSGMPAVFTGTLQGEELSQAYASGDVFVMPSESETLGLVVLEAMASGIPVVAARAGGIPDIIPTDKEGKTGFLYNPRDIEDCLSKLEPLLSNQELRKTIGRAAREETEKYGWRAATRKIRNEQYNAAIWFWRKKRAQLLRPFHWLIRRIFRSPEVNHG